MKQLWDGNIDDNLEVEIVITRLDREITKKKKYFYTFTYILITTKQKTKQIFDKFLKRFKKSTLYTD